MFIVLAQSAPAATAPANDAMVVTAMGLLNSYAHIMVIAFMVTALVTPIVRRVAERIGVVDRPDFARKSHTHPIPYLGGMAVFIGILSAIGVSYAFTGDAPTNFLPVPLAVVIGMIAITFTGLADDVWNWDPRLKIAGQLVAAAALAIDKVGVHVAEGVLVPLFGSHLLFHVSLFGVAIPIDIVYWTGTAIIAIFVLGGCNSANLIDGLDGLLSGVTGIVAVGLLAIALLMVAGQPAGITAEGEGSLGGARIILCMALVGAVLGFLPHNFKPASIFLGDCGSLLLGYLCVVIILMLGEQGQTHLVLAGLIVFAVPIIDTTLAIIRRKLAGTPMSAADNQHLHHQLKRALGGVRRAVFALYCLSFLFAVIGVTLAALVIRTELRLRVIYAIALMLFTFVAVIAVKSARRHQRLAAAAAATAPPPTVLPPASAAHASVPAVPDVAMAALPRAESPLTSTSASTT